MIILGFDPATTCGWAVINENEEHLASGVFTSEKAKKDEHKSKRWFSWNEKAEAIFLEYKPDIVIIEDVRRHVSTLSAHCYGYYRYTLESLCYKYKIPVVEMPIGTWKKKVTGSGAAKKEKVAEVLQLKYPYIIFETNDQSDALGIALGYSL